MCCLQEILGAIYQCQFRVRIFSVWHHTLRYIQAKRISWHKKFIASSCILCASFSYKLSLFIFFFIHQYSKMIACTLKLPTASFTEKYWLSFSAKDNVKILYLKIIYWNWNISVVFHRIATCEVRIMKCIGIRLVLEQIFCKEKCNTCWQCSLFFKVD